MRESENTDFELLSEFARNRDEIDPFLLRNLLADALRRRGYQSIVFSGDGRGLEQPKRRLPGILALTMLWGYGVTAAIGIGLAWYWWPVGVLVVSAAILVAIKLSGESSALGAALLVGWVALGVGEAIQGDLEILAVAYLFPLAAGFAYSAAARLLRLRDAQDVALALGGVLRSAPLVAPVVLIVLFLPALSADVWQVAGALSPTSLLVVGALSVGLLFVVVRLQLGSDVGQVLKQRAEHMSDMTDRADLTRRQLVAATRDDGEVFLDSMADARLEAAWPVAGEEYAPYLKAATGETFQSPLTGRLALTVGAVAVLFTAYVYLLCSAVVPGTVATEWSDVLVPSIHLDFLGMSITLHGGPYLALSALLGLAATATFLSFALVEDRFAKALTDALLRDPADRLLVLALPYLGLREIQIEATRAERQPGGASSSGSGVASSSGK